MAAQLDEDLADLRCRYPGCDRPAPGDSGGCGKHAVTLSQTGRPRPPEAVAKTAAALRGRPRPDLKKHPDEYRRCEWCGEDFGPVLGSRIKQGGGRFCSRKHAALAREAPRKAGAEVECPGCGYTRWQTPSQLERYSGTGYCGDCYHGSTAHQAAITKLAAAARVREARWRELFNEHLAAECQRAVIQVAERAGLTPKAIHYHVRRRALTAQRFRDGRRLVIVPQDEESWFKPFARSDQPLLELWRKSHEFNVAHRRRLDLQKHLARVNEKEADILIDAAAAEDMARRWGAVSGHRSPGRPPGTRTRGELHDWWSQAVNDMMVKEQLSQWAACRKLAHREADYADAESLPDLFPPARYERDPHGGLTAAAEKSAARVIYNAVNRLENVGFKKAPGTD